MGTVGALNEQISAGNIGNIILAQEAIMEKELGNIAEQIAALPDKKLIMIAGPILVRKDHIFSSSFHSTDGTWSEASSNRSGQLFCGTRGYTKG